MKISFLLHFKYEKNRTCNSVNIVNYYSVSSLSYTEQANMLLISQSLMIINIENDIVCNLTIIKLSAQVLIIILKLSSRTIYYINSVRETLAEISTRSNYIKLMSVSS